MWGINTGQVQVTEREAGDKLKISIASGKGGTGKTSVAVGIARSIEYCQFLDYDVEAPNASIFLKPDIKNVEKVTMRQPYFLTETGADFSKCVEFCRYNAVAYVRGKVVFFPELCHGCGGCLLVGPPGAVKERDIEVGKIIRGRASPGIDFIMGDLNPGSLRTVTVQAKLDEYIDEKQTVIIDCPPGTSCPMVASVKNSDFCILVTEPTPFGLNDLEISAEVLRKLGIPHGVIINRDGIGDDSVERFCDKNNIKILEKIPNDINIAKAYSDGITMPEYNKKWIKRFMAVIDLIEKENK
jgi:MinD superfamily P-loop ATPase